MFRIWNKSPELRPVRMAISLVGIAGPAGLSAARGLRQGFRYTHGCIENRMNAPKFVVLASLLAVILPAHADADTPKSSLDAFCTEAQQMLGATMLTSENVVYADLDAFIKSKASPKPLVTRQFIHFDETRPGLPQMISCKLKSSDHLNAEYGPGTAGQEGACQSVNGLTLERVRAARGDVDRPSGVFDNVVLDQDDTGLSGVVWLKPFTMVRVSDANVLHIKSKALYVSWYDERFLDMPARFRGTHYCHLIAPSFLRRLLDGEVAVAGLDM
jgi:hypothetical protein